MTDPTEATDSPPSRPVTVTVAEWEFTLRVND